MAIDVRRRGFRSGQAMIETVIAVLVITFAFLALFELSKTLLDQICLDHAAMRVARARAVGLNRYMCTKAARVATIPIAGERIWPVGESAISAEMELARLPDYMAAENDAYARAILDYEGWGRLFVDPGDGRSTRVSMARPDDDGLLRFDLVGRAGIEANATLYMTDSGL